MAQEKYNFETIYKRFKKLETDILERIISFDEYVTHARNSSQWLNDPAAYKKIREKHPNTFPVKLRNDNTSQRSVYVTSDTTKCDQWSANYTAQNDRIIAGIGPYSSQPEYLAKNIFNFESSLLSTFLTMEQVALTVSLGIGRRSQFTAKENFSDFYHYWHSSNFAVNEPTKFAQVFVENGSALFFDHPSMLTFEDIYQEIKYLPTENKVMTHCLAGIGRTGTFLYLFFQRSQLEDPNILEDYERFISGEAPLLDKKTIDDLLHEKIDSKHEQWRSVSPYFRLLKMSLDILAELRTSRPAIEGKNQFSMAITMLASFYFLAKQDYQTLENWHTYLDSLTFDEPTHHTPVDIFECMPQTLSTITPLSAKLELQKIDLLLNLFPIIEATNKNSTLAPLDNNVAEENNTNSPTYNDFILADFIKLYLAFPNILNSNDNSWEKTKCAEIKNLLQSFEKTLSEFPTDDFHNRDYFILALIKHYFDRFCIRFEMATKYHHDNNKTPSSVFFASKSSAITTLITNCKKTLSPLKKNQNESEEIDNFDNIQKSAKLIIKIIDFYFANHHDCGAFYSVYDFSLTDYHILEANEKPENMLELFSFKTNITKVKYFGYYQNLNCLYYLLLSIDENNYSYNLEKINDMIQNSLKILQAYRESASPADGLIIEEIESLCHSLDSMIKEELGLMGNKSPEVSKN
jgi:hypothetical protein